MVKIPTLYSEIELSKFIDEIVKSNLAKQVYFQLLEDGGNTVNGISNNLKAKGIKASKTRVYEEVSSLLDLQLIMRISNRPPIYTTVQAQANFENISTNYFRDSRQELMQKWASVFPFLPQDMKVRDSTTQDKQSSSSLINFNPYPVVDIYNTNKEDLRRYILRVFESSVINISNNLIQTCLDASDLYYAFGDKSLHVLIDRFKDFGLPVLVGASRKSFIGNILDNNVEKRLPGSLAVISWLSIQEVDLVRVHDVKETLEVIKTTKLITNKNINQF